MRVLIVDGGGLADRIEAGLQEAGIVVDRARDGAGGAQASELAGIAEGLRTFERLLAENRPDGVILDGASNAALAAVLVATKVGVRVARLEGTGNRDSAINRAVIAQLADATLAGDPDALIAWIQGT